MKEKILITGSAGFVGHHLVEHVLENTDWNIIGLDSLRHRGDTERIARNTDRYHFETVDLASPISSRVADKIGPVDYIVNMASESHVDRSITDPVPFVQNNVNLVLNMLEYARLVKPAKFIQISCYDSETKALTKRGILDFKEIGPTDEVLSLNAETNEAEWVGIQKVIIQDYEGPMVHFKTAMSDMLVTPNHRMFYHNSYSDRIKIKEAEAIADKVSLYLPMSHADSVQYSCDKEKYWLSYLIGVFLGDGFYSPSEKSVKNKSGLGHRVFLTIPKEKRCRSKVEQALKELGIEYSTHKDGDVIYFGKHKDAAFFSVFGRGAPNKKCPQEILDYVDKKSLLDGLLDTDGSIADTRTTKFHTCSKDLVSLVVGLSASLGYSPRIYKRKDNSFSQIDGRSIVPNYIQYTVLLRKQKVGIGKGRNNRVDYKGSIWCLKLKKNYNFLTIRNGISSFSGNTDEVYGAAPEGTAHKEWSPILPSNPYAGSKAAQEAIAISYWRTYGVPLIITNTMNLFAERQDKEKFIPMLISRIQQGQRVTIHGSYDYIGKRHYIHARNFADGLLFLLERQIPQAYVDSQEVVFPTRYNVVGEVELNNLEVADHVADILGKPLHYDLVDFHKARPGHDRRYALDGAKLAEFGWKQPKTFFESLEKTIEWTLKHPEWLR